MIPSAINSAAKDIMLKFLSAEQQHDLDAVAALCDPNIVVLDPFFSGPLRGVAVQREIWDNFAKAFPDWEDRILSIAAGDNVAAVELIGTATFKAPVQTSAGAISQTGRRVEARYAVFFRTSSENLIVELNIYYYDLAGFFKQLRGDNA